MDIAFVKKVKRPSGATGLWSAYVLDEDKYLVERVTLDANAAIYHLTDNAHHHLLCTACGSVTEVPSDLFTDLTELVGQRYGFKVPARHVAIAGRCATCRNSPQLARPPE